jgi:glutaredoxin
METKFVVGFIVAIVVILGGIVALNWNSGQSTYGVDLTSVAQCIKDKGATFYGAFWCPHCQATKKMFGAASKHLPYVECSTPDGKSQTAFCTEKGVKQYPTWVFADGTTLTGERSVEELAQKAGCPLPAELNGVTATSTPINTASSSAVTSTTTNQ